MFSAGKLLLFFLCVLVFVSDSFCFSTTKSTVDKKTQSQQEHFLHRNIRNDDENDDDENYDDDDSDNSDVDVVIPTLFPDGEIEEPEADDDDRASSNIEGGETESSSASVGQGNTALGAPRALMFTTAEQIRYQWYNGNELLCVVEASPPQPNAAGGMFFYIGVAQCSVTSFPQLNSLEFNPNITTWQQIKWQNSQYCLSTLNGGMNPNTPLVMETCNGAYMQYWIYDLNRFMLQSAVSTTLCALRAPQNPGAVIPAMVAGVCQFDVGGQV
eukprot:Awhi_evm1s5589